MDMVLLLPIFSKRFNHDLLELELLCSCLKYHLYINKYQRGTLTRVI